MVSTGPPLVAAPNVVGLTQAAASSAITGATLIDGTGAQPIRDAGTPALAHHVGLARQLLRAGLPGVEQPVGEPCGDGRRGPLLGAPVRK